MNKMVVINLFPFLWQEIKENVKKTRSFYHLGKFHEHEPNGSIKIISSTGSGKDL